MATEINVGDEIPIFGQQVRGCYQHGERMDPHFAIPGVYLVERIDGQSVWMRKLAPRGDWFNCGLRDLLAFVGINREYVAKGLNP